MGKGDNKILQCEGLDGDFNYMVYRAAMSWTQEGENSSVCDIVR